MKRALISAPRFNAQARRIFFHAIAAVLVGMMSGTLISSARAAVVFSNYSGFYGGGVPQNELYAERFTPAKDFDLTGVAAYISNSGASQESFSIYLYSSGSSGPSLQLWASGTLAAPASARSLVQANYAGSGLTLTGGTDYFIAVDTRGAYNSMWASGGPKGLTAYWFNGSSWDFSSAYYTLQFEIYGTPVTTTVPEPSTIATMLLGFAGIGVLTYRRRFKPA